MSKSLKRQLAVISLYILFVLIMSWPAITSINTQLIGSGGDPWQVLWRFDESWQAAQLEVGENGIGSAIKHEFGGGEPRLVNLSVWPWMWAHLLLGQPAGYNVIWLLSFALSGYGMYLLSNYLINRREDEEKETKSEIAKQAPAFIAGLVYMLMPYHIAHSFGHFGAMQIQWIPLILLSLFMLLRKQTLVRVALFTLLMTVQAWTEHHYTLWLGVFFVWLLIYLLITKKKRKLTKKTAIYAAITTVILTITVILPYWPTIQLATQTDSIIQLGPEQLIRFSADPIAYIVPASFHPLWGWLSNNIFSQHFTGNVGESTLFLGLLPILLVLFYHQKIPKKQKKFWFITAIIFWIISLGPKLHLMGYVTPIFMPYALIDNFPVLNSVRTVARAAIFVNLSWVILLAWVLKTQIQRYISISVIIFIVLVEFLFWPMPIMPYQMPLAYKQIRDLPGEAVIEIPAATNYQAASKALYGSHLHNKKLINNIALERALGAQAYEEIRSMPALRQLLYLRTDHILEDRQDFFRQDMTETLFDVAKWLKANQIVVHQDSLSQQQRKAVAHLLEEKSGLTRQVVEDTWLYELNNEHQGDGVFISRDDGWKNVALNTSTGEVNAEIKDQAGLVIYNTKDDSVMVQINWKIDEVDSKNLDILTSANVNNYQNSNLEILVKPGKTTMQLINKGEGSIRIIEPRMNVLNK
jgi:hypothetical protein